MFVLGESLGGAAAIHIASKYNKDIDELIVRSTFTSMYTLICSKISTPLAWLLIRYKFDNLSKIQKVTCPILLFHGKGDDLIPIEHVDKLYEKCNKNKSELIKYDGDHNKPPYSFVKEIDDFIKKQSAPN